ncbi:MAG TPA: MtrB/PioB family decaheme-associated outer membrane protein [Ramlibacter sp.]|nr:MtrB/PioB family decaheme-associated outer membrane protein [Ramlibacter sp.]
MTTIIRPDNTRLSLLALAMLSAFGTAQAQLAPAYEANASVGLGFVSGDRADRSLYDQYNGLRPGSHVFGIFDADYYRRDDTKGTAVDFQVTDVLNRDRELGFRWKKQGDWKFSADYRELQRRDPAIPNTGLIGAGTTTPQVVALPGGPGTGSDLDLKTQRTGLGFALSKVISSAWQFDASLQSEKKEGSRLWGIGFTCPSAVAPGCGAGTGANTGTGVLMLPEPIDSRHSQLEARVTFARDKLHLSAGYYGSFYRNENGSLNPSVPGSLFNPVGTLLPLSTGLQPILSQPVALPPDNQAHQLDLTGSYTFTPTTLLNFKLAYSQATQHDNFATAGLTNAPLGVGDLGGKVTTTLAQVGITARPMPKLSLSGNVRYEDRNDQTPLALYNVEDTQRYTNHREPYKNLRAKGQAGYQFNSDYRGTLGVEYQQIDRGVLDPTGAVAGITALRAKTEETGLRAELRRRMAEDLSGAVSIEHSKRDGSNWLKDNSGTGVTEVTDPSAAGIDFSRGIFMPTLADRKRDKVKLNADWQPNERLALQAYVEAGKDRFSSPSSFGLHDSSMNNLGVDWTFAVNDKWNLNGYLSYGRQELNQSRPDAAILDFDNKATSLGLGITGKPMAKLDVGASLSFLQDRSVFQQALDLTAGQESAALLAATGGLPDIVFRQTTLKLFGKYTLDKQSAVRVEVGHQRSTWSDWAWNYNGTPFVYSDGTIINRGQVQKVSFIGVRYTYHWQ